MESIITKNMVIEGYNQGLIRLILSPNGDGIACQIGDNWFYFGGITAEDYNDIEAYKKAIPALDIVKEIYITLKEFEEIYEDEYLYYYYYLKENLKGETEYRFKVSLCDGMWASGTYTVKAASESEAQEKALTEICDKLYSALPELDIEVSVELLEDSEMEDNQ